MSERCLTRHGVAAYEKGIPINYFFSLRVSSGEEKSMRVLELQITSTAQINEEESLVSLACHFNTELTITGQIDRFQTFTHI